MTERRSRVGVLKTVLAIGFIKFSLGYIIVLLAFNLFSSWNIVAELRECFLASPALRSSYVISQLSFTGAIIILIITLFILLHRSLGALPRIEKILDEIINGDYAMRISVRDKDTINSFVVKLNKILDLVEKKEKG